MEFDQEKTLDLATKVIKEQAFHLSKAIENNNLRLALKESSIMLAELKSGSLSPKNYYILFSSILDELYYLESYFKEEHRRGRKIKHLYDSVQQAQNIIPRIYLMITAGRVYIDSGEMNVNEIIFELLNSIKGVQNPTRGLFLRYYLLKMIKDKLIDTPEELDTTLKFIMQNLDEMNRLWIRLSTGCSGNEKLIREKERNELKVLVGENIIRLSSLESVSLQKYQEEILPKLINILLDSKDGLSQHYFIDCIIHAFPENFNITCMDIILDAITKLVPTVDIKSIFINLMEKLSKYLGKDTQGTIKISEEETDKIFNMLKSNIDKIVEENLSQSPTNELKVIELLVAYMRFTLNSCPIRNRLEMVNHVMSSGLATLKSASSNRLSADCVKQVIKLLTVPLENGISIFTIKDFSSIMIHLDYQSKSNLALNILDSFSSEKSKEVIDSLDKLNLLLDYISPLTISSDNEIQDKSQFRYEQIAVSKFVFFLKEKSPINYHNMLLQLQNTYVKGGKDRILFTLPTLINVYLNFIHILYSNYTNREAPSGNKSALYTQFLENHSYNFESISALSTFIRPIYENILDLISSYLIPSNYENSFQLLLSLLNSINLCKDFDFKDLSNRISLLTLENLTDGDKRVQYLILFIANLYNIKSISQEDYDSLVNKVSEIGFNLNKRIDQSKVSILISNLYYPVHYQKKEEDCLELLSKAKEFADYGMSINPQQGLILYIQILNKNIHYIEQGATFLKAKKISKLIDNIKNLIKSIKTEHKEANYLDDIERYLNETLNLIGQRKTSSEKGIYKEILI